MQYLKLLLLFGLLAGCASTDSTNTNEQNDKLEISYNSNNEITKIVAQPRRNLCLLTNNNCSWIGATWDASSPSEVELLVHFRAGFDIRKAILYIDEYPIELIKGETVTQYYSHSGSFAGMRGDTESSTKAYRMPLEMFNRILAAKTVAISNEPFSRAKRHLFDKIATEKKKGPGYQAIASLVHALNKA